MELECYLSQVRPFGKDLSFLSADELLVAGVLSRVVDEDADVVKHDGERPDEGVVEHPIPDELIGLQIKDDGHEEHVATFLQLHGLVSAHE